ncbi:MAG: ABC transporter substrate-binding protein [Pseudomonadota bacterium]
MRRLEKDVVTSEWKVRDFCAQRHLLSRREFLVSGILTSAIILTPSLGRATQPDQKMKLTFVHPNKGYMELEARSLMAGFDLSSQENGPCPIEIFRKNYDQNLEETLREVQGSFKGDEINFIVCFADVEGSQRVVETFAKSRAIVFLTNPSIKLVCGEVCQPNVFRSSPNNYVLSEPLAPWAVINAGRKVFITGDDDQSANEKADSFAFGFERAGGSFCDRVMVSDSSATIDSVVSSIGNSDADFVFAAFENESALKFLQAVKSVHPKTRKTIVGPETLTSFSKTEQAVEETVIGVPTLTNVTNVQSLRSKIFTKFGSEAMSIPRVAEGFDLARIIDCVASEGATGERDLERVIKAISNSKINGMRGEFRFDKNHDAILDSWVVSWVKGERELRQEIIASLGASVSLDFGCGRVGYPNRPDAVPMESEGVWEEN